MAYSVIHKATRLRSCWWLHSHPMDIFPFCRNCTSQSHKSAGNCKASGFVYCPVTVLFTKPLASQLPSFAWYNSCGTEKCPLAVNGSCYTDRSLETILYGGRQSCVNRTVTAPSQSHQIGCCRQESSSETALLFTANRHFSVLHGTAGNNGASSWVNGAVKGFFFLFRRNYASQTRERFCRCR